MIERTKDKIYWCLATGIICSIGGFIGGIETTRMYYEHSGDYVAIKNTLSIQKGYANSKDTFQKEIQTTLLDSPRIKKESLVSKVNHAIDHSKIKPSKLSYLASHHHHKTHNDLKIIIKPVYTASDTTPTNDSDTTYSDTSQNNSEE